MYLFLLYTARRTNCIFPLTNRVIFPHIACPLLPFVWTVHVHAHKWKVSICGSLKRTRQWKLPAYKKKLAKGMLLLREEPLSIQEMRR